MAGSLLSVDGLRVAFAIDDARLVAVDGVSFDVPRGRTVGLVGESGSGKSVTALAIMRLLPDSATIESGSIRLEGDDLVRLSEPRMRELRGGRIAMVFQEPMTALNPVHTVGAQIAEAVRAHAKVSRSTADRRAVELLSEVGIPAPERRAQAYPHELSGGMRQRVMIAIALAGSPSLLIADEPTTALDVTVQGQILDLLARLQRERGMSILLITHDLGVVAEFVEEVLVMYAGRIVERVSVRELFGAGPRHPYTAGLLRSLPSYDDNAEKKRLPTIQGTVPDLASVIEGCRFAPRCERATERCIREAPELVTDGARAAACFHPLPGGGPT